MASRKGNTSKSPAGRSGRGGKATKAKPKRQISVALWRKLEAKAKEGDGTKTAEDLAEELIVEGLAAREPKEPVSGIRGDREPERRYTIAVDLRVSILQQMKVIASDRDLQTLSDLVEEILIRRMDGKIPAAKGDYATRGYGKKTKKLRTSLRLRGWVIDRAEDVSDEKGYHNFSKFLDQILMGSVPRMLGGG